MMQRVLAAVVGLLMVVPAIAWFGLPAVQIIVAIVLVICLDEYRRMAAPSLGLEGLVALLAAGGLVFGMMVWGDAALATPALAAGTVGLMVFAMLRVPDTTQASTLGLRLVAGLVYIPVLLAFIPWICEFESGRTWIALLLTITWAGDTGAYFAGRAFGRHKLFERVSPKKTWEGAAGGMVAAILGAGVVKTLGLPGLPWLHCVLLAILVDAVGITGDLVESMLKRSFGVKDSGSIMPGHGGLLDRVDALLFTAPVAWIYATLFDLG